MTRDVVKTPQSLKEIEKFIADSTVDYENATNVNDLRLQAYRTAFDAIMEELKTYRPVLAKIKAAYDASLNDAKETRRELDDTRQALLVISEKCEAKLAEHKQSQNQNLLDSRDEVKSLKLKIKEMEENKEWFQSQVDKLKIDLSDTYKLYRDERDARKILVSELRSQQAAESGEIESKKNEENKNEESLDPVKLKLALEVAREDLKKLTDELFRVKSDYGDVVPRRDFENLQTVHDKLMNSNEVIEEDFSKMKTEHTILMDTQAQIQTERDDYCKQADVLRKNATPRPNWKEMAGSWPEGSDDYESKTIGQSTSEQVAFLAKHFAKNDSINSLQARGVDNNVPLHLRYYGEESKECNIFNRNFERNEISAWIDKIWQVKSVRKNSSEQDLQQVFLDVLNKHFNSCESVVFEYAYSLDYGIEKFSDEPHIKTFGDILYKRIHESILFRHNNVIAQVRTTLSALAAAFKTEDQSLDKVSICRALQKAFPLKNSDDIDQIETVLGEFEKESHDSDTILYEMAENTDNTDLGIWQFLFSQDEFGRRSKFLKLIILQDERAKTNFIQEIQAKLEGFEDIGFSDASSTLMELDPEANENRKLALCAGFHVKTYKEAKEYDGTIACTRFLEGLCKAGVFRSGPQIRK